MYNKEVNKYEISWLLGMKMYMGFVQRWVGFV